MTPEELQSCVHLPAWEVAQSLTSLKGGSSTRGFAPCKVAGEETTRGQNELSPRLVTFEERPRIEKALEDEMIRSTIDSISKLPEDAHTVDELSSASVSGSGLGSGVNRRGENCRLARKLPRGNESPQP